MSTARTMSTALGFAAAALTLGAAGASAVADDLRVPSKQYPLIANAAIDAKPGDRIVVRGRVRGGTRIALADVVLDLRRARLDGRLIVDGPRTTVLGGDLRGGLSVAGDGVVVRRSRVRGAGAEDLSKKPTWLVPNVQSVVVWVLGDDVTLDGLRVHAPRGAEAIAGAAERLVVHGCDVRGGTAGADLDGGALVVTASRFVGAQRLGLGATSFDAAIRGNVVSNVALGAGVLVRGDGASVEGNAVRSCQSGIVCIGATPVVRGNRVSSTDGVAVGVASGSSSVTIDSNVVRGARGLGVFASGDAGAITGNRVARQKKRARALPDGFIGSVDFASLASSDAGVFVDGGRNEVTDNVVTGGPTGIAAVGCSNVVRGAVVRDVELDGLVVAGNASSVVDAVVERATRDVVTFGSVSVGDAGTVNVWSFSTVPPPPATREPPSTVNNAPIVVVLPPPRWTFE